MIEREAVSMRIDAYNAVSQVYKTSAYAKDKSIAVKKTRRISTNYQIQPRYTIQPEQQLMKLQM